MCSIRTVYQLSHVPSDGCTIWAVHILYYLSCAQFVLSELYNISALHHPSSASSDLLTSWGVYHLRWTPHYECTNWAINHLICVQSLHSNIWVVYHITGVPSVPSGLCTILWEQSKLSTIWAVYLPLYCCSATSDSLDPFSTSASFYWTVHCHDGQHTLLCPCKQPNCASVSRSVNVFSTWPSNLMSFHFPAHQCFSEVAFLPLVVTDWHMVARTARTGYVCITLKSATVLLEFV